MESTYSENIDYRRLANRHGAKKRLGQNFLVKRGIAVMEAAYAKGMNVVELGPGFGILTRELCRTAKGVVAIEKDPELFDRLKGTLISKKLRLMNNDFFSVDPKELEGIDIMVSNIPYSLSSRVIYWLSSRNMPALICMQKEFTEHMLAKPGTSPYSRLSVVSALTLRVHHVRNVPASSFVPRPKVDSCIVYIAPKGTSIDEGTMKVISLIMNHKKKRIRNAIVDSSKGLGITKKEADALFPELDIPNERPLFMNPEELLGISKIILKHTSQKE